MLAIIIKAAKILGDGRKVPNYTALASAIGCHRSSLYCWARVPSHYVNKIVKATGGKITASQLRPDLAKAEKQVQRKTNNGPGDNIRLPKRGKKICTTDVVA